MVLLQRKSLAKRSMFISHEGGGGGGGSSDDDDSDDGTE